MVTALRSKWAAGKAVRAGLAEGGVNRELSRVSSTLDFSYFVARLSTWRIFSKRGQILRWLTHLWPHGCDRDRSMNTSVSVISWEKGNFFPERSNPIG